MKRNYFIKLGLWLVMPLSAFSQNCGYICNEGFDSTFITSTVGVVTSSTLPCWKTTAADGQMEIWANGYNGVPSYSGIQFLEINATMAATVYQDFVAGPGSVLSIGFAHRGRGGIDTMSVSVGPVGGPYTVLGYYGDGESAWGYYTVNYTVPGPATNYQLRFTAEYWGFGNPGVGNMLDAVSVCNVTGTNEVENNGYMNIFPNPSSGDVFLKTDGKPAWVEIYTPLGLKLGTFILNGPENKLDLHHLANGNYILKTYDNQHVMQEARTLVIHK